MQLGKRVFQLTFEQPVDECLALLGDCLVADLERRAVEPVITICRRNIDNLTVRPTPIYPTLLPAVAPAPSLSLTVCSAIYHHEPYATIEQLALLHNTLPNFVITDSRLIIRLCHAAPGQGPYCHVAISWKLKPCPS